MEDRLAQFLRRIGEADRALRRSGRDPEQFILIYAGGMTINVLHSGWDDSWPSPTSQDIDDLGELGYLRVQPSDNLQRKFDLTVRGREQTEVLDQPGTAFVGGTAPSLDVVLDWLLVNEARLAEELRSPDAILDVAEAEGLIEGQGREALADRIVNLFKAGYLDGDLPDLDQATSVTRLELSEGLSLSMKAHDRGETKERGPSITVLGSVIASQVATGNIENFVSFTQVLDQAEETIAQLDDVDEASRDEALSLIDVLKGKGADIGGQTLSGAGGGLLAAVLGKLIGL